MSVLQDFVLDFEADRERMSIVSAVCPSCVQTRTRRSRTMSSPGAFKDRAIRVRSRSSNSHPYNR
jgi:hypothetical protein